MGPSAPPRCATAPNALALAERGHCATCSPQVWTPYVKTKGMGPASNLGISTDGTFESMTLKHTKNVNASTENNNSNRKRATFCKKGLARQELEPWNGTYSFTTLIVIPVSQLYILFFQLNCTGVLAEWLALGKAPEGIALRKQPRMVRPSTSPLYFTRNCISICQRQYTQDHSLCQKRARIEKKKEVRTISTFLRVPLHRQHCRSSNDNGQQYFTVLKKNVTLLRQRY